MVREQKSIYMHVTREFPEARDCNKMAAPVKELAKFASFSEFPTKIALKCGDFVSPDLRKNVSRTFDQRK